MTVVLLRAPEVSQKYFLCATEPIKTKKWLDETQNNPVDDLKKKNGQTKTLSMLRAPDESL